MEKTHDETEFFRAAIATPGIGAAAETELSR
jgi:hypothetical protein